MVKVVVVEDDPKIRSALGAALERAGYGVALAGDGATALPTVLTELPDLILLDLGLPDVEGSTLLAMLRSVGDTPVIALTARTEPTEIIRILDLGADDYVTKPFDFNQLDARIKAVLRRSGSDRRRARNQRVTVGNLTFDQATRVVTFDGVTVQLRHLEAELLLALALADGQLVPMEALIRRLWGPDISLTDGAGRLDVQLSLLRSKLGESARRPRYLQRVRGVGIRLLSPGGV